MAKRRKNPAKRDVFVNIWRMMGPFFGGGFYNSFNNTINNKMNKNGRTDVLRGVSRGVWYDSGERKPPAARCRGGVRRAPHEESLKLLPISLYMMTISRLKRQQPAIYRHTSDR